ncbi:MAG: hypothetical protein JXN61_11705 [Sedimentisphaerales bacterium]|nr:hypothetical protein [Sedimentisphaerales bacterium]
MLKKCRAIKIGEHGFLADEGGDPILCPIRGANCTLKCAWLSLDDKIFRCQKTVIGALRGKPMQSFRLHSGPLVHNFEQTLTEYELPD